MLLSICSTTALIAQEHPIDTNRYAVRFDDPTQIRGRSLVVFCLTINQAWKREDPPTEVAVEGFVEGWKASDQGDLAVYAEAAYQLELADKQTDARQYAYWIGIVAMKRYRLHPLYKTEHFDLEAIREGGMALIKAQALDDLEPLLAPNLQYLAYYKEYFRDQPAPNQPRRQLRQAMGERLQKEYSKGRAFLQQQAYDPTIVVLLDETYHHHHQYKVIREGAGQRPNIGDLVVFRSCTYDVGAPPKEKQYQVYTKELKDNNDRPASWLFDFKEGEIRQYTTNAQYSGDTVPKGGCVVYEVELIRIIPRSPILLDGWTY